MGSAGLKKGIVVVIVLTLAGLLIWQQSPASTSQSLPTLPSLTLAEIEQFEIKRQGKVLVQAKRENLDWLMMGLESATHLQTNLVEQLLTDIVNMQVKRVASTKAEHQNRFSVAENDTQLVLSAKDGSKLLSVMVGKPATDLRSTYVRLTGEHTVITVDKVLTWQVNRAAKAWLEEDVTSEP